MKHEDFMTGYEIREYKGYKKTAGDELKNKSMFQTAVKNRLAMEEQVRLPSGETVKVSAVELLVDAKLQDDLDHPERIDLVKWQKAAGEEVIKTENEVKGADELFGDIIINK